VKRGVERGVGVERWRFAAVMKRVVSPYQTAATAKAAAAT
jgi:hypothetical protein